MEKSTNKAEVFRVKEVLPHPNADMLEIVSVGAYASCVKKGDFKEGDLGIFIPPDNLVDSSREHFSFLGKGEKVLIRAKKLRGYLSYGLVIPLPSWLNAEEQEDVAGKIGVTHYEPPEERITGGEVARGPDILTFKYDVDSCWRYYNLVPRNVPLLVTQKINGSNARYVWDGEMHVGSRTEWKKYDERSIWWQALKNTPALEEFCKKNPRLVVYGEVYGHVGGYKYGRNSVGFAAFDILHNGNWLIPKEARQIAKDIPWVPAVEEIILKGDPAEKDYLTQLASCSSILDANTLNEGVVLEGLKENFYDSKVGRIKFKVINPAYLLRK